MFYKKWITALVLLLVISTIISGCGVFKKKNVEEPMNGDEDLPNLEIETPDDSQDRETILYYQDDSGYLVPIMRRIEWEEGIAKATLSKLMDTPEQQQEILGMGLKALLPGDARVNGISINDGLAKVDLNDRAMEYADAVAENNMVQGIVRTLTEFPSIDKVQLVFEGKSIDSLKFGTKVGEPIEPKDINLELAPDSIEGGAEVTVFFHNTSPSRYEYLVPVTRVTSSSSANIETAMEELLKGPKADCGLHMDIPIDVQVLGVQMDEGITYVNFSKEFDSLIDSESEPTVLKAITMTAKGFPGIADVQILVEGKEYRGESSVATAVFANEY